MATREEILKELEKRNVDINTIIDTASEMHGLEPSMVHSMIKQESNYNPKAVSSKGAIGMMQLMPGTAKELGVGNPLNPIENVLGGTKYLSSLKNEFGGDMGKALAAYNAGRENVKKYNGVPPFKETQDYVNKILPAKSKKEFAQFAPPIFTKRDVYNELKNRGMDDEEIFDTILKANPIKEKPSFWQGLIKEIPEFGGAFVGSLAGIPGGVPGMVGGAMIGGAAGKALQQLGQRVFEPEKAPKTATEAAQQIGKAGVTQAGYEIGGQLIGKVAGKILAPFAKSILPETQIARQILDAYMPVERRFFGLTKRKIPSLLPHEATENRTLDVLFNISEGSLIGGRKVSKFKVDREKAISDVIDDLIAQFGTKAEPDMVGEAFQLAIDNNLQSHKLITNPMYEKVEQMASKIPININNIKSFAMPLAQRAKEIGSIEAKNAGDDLITAVLELEPNISFGAAKDLRTRLMSRIDEFNIINKKAPAIGKAKKMIGLLDNSIESSLNTYNKDALSLWRQANNLYKEGQEKYNNIFIRRLIKKADPNFGGEPESIVKAIFKPGAISNIQRVKTAVDPATFKQMKSWYMQSLIKQATDKEGKIVGTTLNDRLFGKTGMGEKTLREIFDPAELQRIKNVTTTLQIVTGKQTEGTGKMWIQLAQASAAIGVITGQFRAPSLFVLGTPEVLTRIILNPFGNKLLTNGFKLPPGSPQFMANMTRLIGLSHKIQSDINTEIRIKEQEMLKGYQDLEGVSTLK